MNSAFAARMGAIAIAIAAAIDPACTVTRQVPVPVSMIYDEASRRFAGGIRDSLDGFAVTDGASPSAQASIVVRARDGRLPAIPETGPVFVIDDPTRASALTIRSIDMPLRVLHGRAVTASVLVEASDDTGRTVRIELRSGQRLLASEERTIQRRGSTAIPLRFSTPGTGVIPLRVEIGGAGITTAADTAVHVVDRPLRVHVIEGRPSWSSTFVRRALEEDPAFHLSTDTNTSRGVAVTTGTPPRIDDITARESIDVIVIGAIAELTAPSVRAIEAFARERGGAVVVLADTDSEAAIEALTGVSWQRRTSRDTLLIPVPQGTFLFTDGLLTGALPPGASAIAASPSGTQTIVADIPMGNGRLIVNGAIDAWKFRAHRQSQFAAFWRAVIGEAAMSAAPPFTVDLSTHRVAAGETVEIEAVMRGAREGEPLSVEGVLESGGGKVQVRFWPAPAPGVFTARVVAPEVEGHAILRATARAGGNTHSAEAPLLIAPTEHVRNIGMGVPIVLAAARDGAYTSNGDVETLARNLRLAFPEYRAPARTHPMRYAWWIAPFTLLLGYEWRWRRQRGLK